MYAKKKIDLHLFRILNLEFIELKAAVFFHDFLLSLSVNTRLGILKPFYLVKHLLL